MGSHHLLRAACVLLVGGACARAPAGPTDPARDGGWPDASTNPAATCARSLADFCQNPRGNSFPVVCPATLAEALREPLFCRPYSFPVFARRQGCDPFQVLSVFSTDHGELYFFDAAGTLAGIVHFQGTRVTCLGGAPGFTIPFELRCTERTPIACSTDAGV